MTWYCNGYFWLTIVFTILSFCVFSYTFYQKSSDTMIFFAISMFSIFFTCLVSILEITAVDANSALIAVQLGYVGRIFSVLFLIKFVFMYCHISIHKTVERVVAYVNLILIIIVFSTKATKLFYTDYYISNVDGISIFNVTPGPFYYIMMLDIYALGIICVGFVLYKRKSITNRDLKNKYTLLTICILCPAFGLTIYVLFLQGGFDLLPSSLVVSSMLFFFSMKNHFLFDITQNGKEYVLDNSDEAVMILDGHYRILYHNQKAKELTQYLDDSDYINADKVDILFHDKTDFMLEGAFYESHFTKIIREDGMVEGYLLEARDITEYHKTMENTRKTREEAENASKAKSEFLANMSHEIRTPINAILGMNEMILRENTNPVIEEYAGSIEKAGNALLSLINDILNLSKIESGKMEAHVAAYDTKELLLSLKKMIETHYPGKETDYNVVINKNIPSRLYGDMNRITHLIMNAISSASYYIRNKESIVYFDFLAKAIDRSVPMIYSDLSNDTGKRYPEIWLQMKIDDHNERVTPQEFERLLDNLNPDEISHKNKYDKDELKPAIVSRLMSSMKAKLYMNLNDDGYLVTTLSIPQGVIDDTPIGEERLENETVKNRLFEAEDATILVVDDNMVNLKVIVALLKRTKIKVDIAKSGKECLEKVQNQRYDMIFMDHLMPEMDGIETFHNLKKSDRNQSKDSPVVILTANAVSGAKEMYLKEGFSDYLMKPVVCEDLEKCIISFLEPEKIKYICET